MKKMGRKFLGVIGVIIILFTLNACNSVAYTGRSRMLVTSESEEAQMGTEYFEEFKKTVTLSKNQNYVSALNRTATNLTRAADADGHKFDWEFIVVEDATANAFCVPGGKIAVLSGLYKYTANDAELATVVAHEIAHAIARHSGEQIATSSALNVGIMASAITANCFGIDGSLISYGAEALGAAGNLGVILPYSRAHEYEADYIGLLLLAKAGYDPRTAVTFWKKFGQDTAGASVMVYFSTHPMGADRIEALESHMDEALKFYAKSAKRGVGQTISK